MEILTNEHLNELRVAAQLKLKHLAVTLAGVQKKYEEAKLAADKLEAAAGNLIPVLTEAKKQQDKAETKARTESGKPLPYWFVP